MSARPAEPVDSAAAAASGRTYLWCKCGRSFARPFCDGTHDGGGCCRRDDAAEDATGVALGGLSRMR